MIPSTPSVIPTNAGIQRPLQAAVIPTNAGIQHPYHAAVIPAHAGIHRPRNAANTIASLFLLLVTLVLVCWLSGGSVLVMRPMWMDEVHSWLIVSDPDPAHAFVALANGVDFNPPGWFWITRLLSSMIGGPSEVQLRLFSVGWMLLAAVGLFQILAQRVGIPGSGIAVTIALAHPLIVHQATEIRFYSFWCAAVVWLVFAVYRNERATHLGLATSVLLSIAVSTCHYFGILSILLVLIPALSHRSPLNRTAFVRARAALIAGIVSVLCCVPVLRGQRAALTVPTWISPPTMGDSFAFLTVFFPAWKILLCAVLAIIVCKVRATRRTRGGVFDPTELSRSPLFEDSAVRAVSLLALMPLVIVGVSWLMQPALVTRYAVTGLLGLTPGFAWLLSMAGRRVQFAAGLAAISGLMMIVTTIRNDTIKERTADRELADAIERAANGCPVIFEDRIRFSALKQAFPNRAATWRLADFDDSQLLEQSNLRTVQRDVGRQIQKWYSIWPMMHVDDATQFPRWIVVPYEGAASTGLRWARGVDLQSVANGLLIAAHAEPEALADCD